MKLKQFNYVLWQATRASFLAQEKNSSLGLIWHLLNPLFMTGVLFLVFRETQRFGQIDNYGLFILIGLVHYNFFINSTQRCAEYFLSSRPLILNTTVPLELLVLRQSCIEGLMLAVEILLVLILGVFMGANFTINMLFYPLVLIGLLSLGIGASFFLCALVIFLTDLKYVWSVFCRLLFFLTPVFYSPAIVDSGLAQKVLWLNPLTRLITLARKMLLTGEPVALVEVGQALVGPLLVLALGLFLFKVTRDRIPDYI